MLELDGNVSDTQDVISTVSTAFDTVQDNEKWIAFLSLARDVANRINSCSKKTKMKRNAGFKLGFLDTIAGFSASKPRTDYKLFQWIIEFLRDKLVLCTKCAATLPPDWQEVDPKKNDIADLVSKPADSEKRPGVSFYYNEKKKESTYDRPMIIDESCELCKGKGKHNTGDAWSFEPAFEVVTKAKGIEPKDIDEKLEELETDSVTLLTDTIKALPGYEKTKPISPFYRKITVDEKYNYSQPCPQCNRGEENPSCVKCKGTGRCEDSEVRLTMMGYAKAKLKETKDLYTSLKDKKQKVLALYSQKKDEHKTTWTSFLQIFSDLVKKGGYVKTAEAKIVVRKVKEKKEAMKRKMEAMNRKLRRDRAVRKKKQKKMEEATEKTVNAAGADVVKPKSPKSVAEKKPTTTGSSTLNVDAAESAPPTKKKNKERKKKQAKPTPSKRRSPNPYRKASSTKLTESKPRE